MSISSLSFWQQDQNWLTSQQSWSNQVSNSNLAMSAMASALSNKSSGIASIYNQEALSRVTKELQSAATAALNGTASASASPSFAPSSTVTSVPFNYAPALASSGTAATMLSSVISGASSNSVGSMLSNLITGGSIGSSVNILA
jgi:hypothetical protein